MASELEVGKVKIAEGGELIIDKAEAGSGTIRFYKGAAASSYIQYDASENLVHYMPSSTGEQQFYTGGSKRLSISSTGLAEFSAGVTLSGGILSVGGFTELTISSGVVTATSSFHFVDTEGDASSDDLRTVNGGAVGSVLTLACATASRPVTLKDWAGGSDNLLLAGDCTLDNTHDTITLIKDGNYWLETSRSNNA